MEGETGLRHFSKNMCKRASLVTGTFSENRLSLFEMQLKPKESQTEGTKPGTAMQADSCCPLATESLYVAGVDTVRKMLQSPAWIQPWTLPQ